MEDSFVASLKSARSYGLDEFLEIIGELSQQSTKKGALDRQIKELITLGIALSKDCSRCIKIHTRAAVQLKATPAEIEQVRRTHLFLEASPKNSDLWKSWKTAWLQFVLGKSDLKHHEVELIALGIALRRQSGKHIKLHVRNALEYGASKQQVFEVMPIVLLMDGAPALSQIPKLIQALEMEIQK